MSSLFQQFSEGAEEAFSAYYERYYKNVFGSLKRFCDDNALAQDLTQEVFEDAWHRRAKFNDEVHLRNALFKKAKSSFLEHRRREKIAGKAWDELSRTMEHSDVVIDRILVQEEAIAALADAMLKLPHQQKIVVDDLLNGATVGAIAERLQLSPQTVRNHKSQAIRFLRTELYSRGLSLAVLLITHLLCFYPF